MSKKVIVIEPLEHELPIAEVLDWLDFQLFCTDVLFNRPGITVAREYLTQGSRQEGIDIYGVDNIDGRLITAQCKLEKYLSPQDIDDLVTLFLNGEFASKSKEFIICTSFDLSKHRTAEQTIDKAREKLADAGVELTVWDKKGLATELRNNPLPGIVSRYLGMSIAETFYGETYRKWFKDARGVQKPNYKADNHYIARKLTTYKEFHDWTHNPYQQTFEGKFDSLISHVDSVKSKEPCRYLVLSIAGFGKTCELKHIAAHYAAKDQYLFPIRSFLSDYEGQPIAELLSAVNPEWGTIGDEALILVFDGMDEIRDIYFQSFVNHLNQFCEGHPFVKVVVSTRFNFYDLVNPPLRGFEILVLHPFSDKDIREYINSRAPGKYEEFIALVKNSRFEEFIDNPYYLARLVKFFKTDTSKFPTTKPELFQRVLFEKFDSDNSKATDAVARADFFKAAQKIAYTMTVLGESVMSNEQMELLMPEKKQRAMIMRFFLLNKNASDLNDWSFEHKNLQEYLCASFLQQLSLDSILAIATYPYDAKRIQSKFVNTFSFLFINIERPSALFDDLLQWLIDHQPELLVRFEKARVPREVRFSIFKSILSSYKGKNRSLHSSSSFYGKELADFVDIDEEVIAYIDQEIDKDTTEWYAFEGIDVIGHCNRAFVHEGIIKKLLIKIISSPAFSEGTKANAIAAFTDLEIKDKDTYEAILACSPNLGDIDIRIALIHHLNAVDYFEDHISFLIESWPVMEMVESRMSRLGTAEFLKKIILRSQRPLSIIKILQYALESKDALNIHEHGDAKIDAEEFKALMAKAADIYPDNQRLLPLIYRFYCGDQVITLYKEWFSPVVDFFEKTAGIKTIFHKLYKHRGPERNLVELAGKEELEFLIEEHRNGKLTTDQIRVFRNILSHTNRELFDYFYERINAEFANVFHIEDKDFDFQAHWQSYEHKNQQMLIDSDLFFQEIEAIFATLGLETVTKSDFHNYQNYNLQKFQQSIVLSKLRLDADKIPKSKAAFISELQRGNNWEVYKINQVMQLLRKKKPDNNFKLAPGLKEFATAWSKAKLIELNYLHSVSDNGQGTVNFTHEVEFNNELYLKLGYDLEDDLLIKMLPSDFRGGMNDGSLGLAGHLIEKIKDKALLKSAVLAFLKMDLAAYVQKTLYAVCAELGYTECLPQLYKLITTPHPNLWGSDKCFLSKVYLRLGGQVQDFRSFIQVPPIVEEQSYLSWNWFLIEKYLDIAPSWVAQFIRPALTDLEQPHNHKVLAAEYLIRIGEVDGLRFWSDYVIANSVTPFENRLDIIRANIHRMDYNLTLPILFQTMEPFIITDAERSPRDRNPISDFIIDLFRILVQKNTAAFEPIMLGLKPLIVKYDTPKTTYWLNRYKEELIQDYNTQTVQIPSIEEIGRAFDAALA